MKQQRKGNSKLVIRRRCKQPPKWIGFCKKPFYRDNQFIKEVFHKDLFGNNFPIFGFEKIGGNC
jgi:hypothetical protein